LSFLNPALLFGTLLFAVPLIIHLLNRQRYKRRRWAAMEYLLIAFKRQRRRLRIEDLLLLLLRCLIPIILALAIARPVLREGGPIAGLGSSAHYFVVLDASYSMGFEPEGAISPFRAGRRIVEQLLQRLQDRDGGTKITLVIAGMRPTVPVQADLEMTRAASALANLTNPDDSANDLTDALMQVADLVEESTDTDKRVYVITDMQVRAFGPDPLTAQDTGPAEVAGELSSGEAVQTARDALDQLSEIADLYLLDVGPTAEAGTGGSEDNMQITELRIDHLAAVTRVEVPVVATVLNRTSTARTAQVTLEIDGAEPKRRVVELEAGAEVEVNFQVTFRETGKRMLRAYLQGDGLPADDERFMTLDVRERIRILVVDGTASAGVPADIREAALLADLLDPTRGEGPPELTVFDPKIIEPLSLATGEEDLKSYSLVVLANLDVLAGRTVAEIEDALRAGTGLLVMLGDQTDVSSFNMLWRGGDGPMPLFLTHAQVQPSGSDSLYTTIVRRDHPVFADLQPEVLEATPITGFLAADPDNFTDTGQVLATLNNARQDPLLVAHQFGNGKALFLTSAASRRPDKWNQFHEPRVAFPLFHRMVYWLSLPAQDPFNTQVGALLTCALEERPTDVAVVLPERAGQRREPIADESRPLPGGRFSLPPFHRTRFAGFYNFEMILALPTGNEETQFPFAVNVNPDEGDLSYFAHDAAVERLGVTRILRGLPAEGSFLAEAGSAELGPPLLMMVLLLVLGEAAMARFVTRRRS
jgi:hypothetical protein